MYKQSGAIYFLECLVTKTHIGEDKEKRYSSVNWSLYFPNSSSAMHQDSACIPLVPKLNKYNYYCFLFNDIDQPHIKHFLIIPAFTYCF